MFRSFLVISLLLLFPSMSLYAYGSIHATSDYPSEVYLDEQCVGKTPIQINRILPGDHEIRFVQTESGLSEQYPFYLQEGGTSRFYVNFSSKMSQQAVYSGRNAGYYQPRYNSGYYQPQIDQCDGYIPQRPHYPYDNCLSPYEQSRMRNRTRNSLLGAGLVNEIFNNGRSKRGVRGGILGGVLLNEIFGR